MIENSMIRCVDGSGAESGHCAMPWSTVVCAASWQDNEQAAEL